MEERLYLLRCMCKELIHLVQHQMSQTQEQETVAGQQADQGEGRGDQQQAWAKDTAALSPQPAVRTRQDADSQFLGILKAWTSSSLRPSRTTVEWRLWLTFISSSSSDSCKAFSQPGHSRTAKGWTPCTETHMSSWRTARSTDGERTARAPHP